MFMSDIFPTTLLESRLPYIQMILKVGQFKTKDKIVRLLYTF